MRVQPAKLDQVLSTTHGEMVLISSDVGNVAADLKAIDPCLKVRFAENGQPPFFAVYHESPDGRETQLVTTVQAYQSATGIWTGLDQRVVDRIREIDGHGRSGYDFALELERSRVKREREQRAEFRERIGERGEQMAHALRKDLGLGSYRGRIFKPRDIAG